MKADLEKMKASLDQMARLAFLCISIIFWRLSAPIWGHRPSLPTRKRASAQGLTHLP
jgi:hypothetical protein